jgi:hypothetical protein
MKVEQAKQIVSAAIEQLCQALERGHSETLRNYLAAIGRFHRYSLRNVMLIASQRAVTCCYTSLESMNMRSCALLEASDGA